MYLENGGSRYSCGKKKPAVNNIKPQNTKAPPTANPSLLNRSNFGYFRLFCILPTQYAIL